MGQIHHVCMISSLHGLYDDRIYWKEAISLKKTGYDVTHVAVGDIDKDFISEHGIRLIQIKKKQYFRNPYFDKLYRITTFKPDVYQKILEIAGSLKADVYHFHDLQINKIGRKLKSLPHGPKVIYDVHEPYPEAFRYIPSSNFITRLIHFLFSFYIRFWELRCSRYYDLVIATEENVAGKFQNYLKSAEKVRIIYNYTDLKSDRPSKSHDKKKYDAIYSGSIRSTRGIFEIISAIKIARDKDYLLKVLFIGPVFEKNLKKKIVKFIHYQQLDKNIILKDPVSYSEIYKYYEASKAGLIIFRDNPVNRIILPIKLFEYMAFGLPVICSNFGHMKAYTDKNKTGLTVNPGNPHDICEKLLILMTDKNLYNIMSGNSLSATKDHYSWEKMEKKLNEIYESLIKEDVYSDQ